MMMMRLSSTNMSSITTNNNNNNNSDGGEAAQATSEERWKSTTSGERPRAPGCVATVLAELNPCQDWYLVRDTVTGRKLDVQHTFGPVGRYALLLKLFGTSFCLSTLVYSMIDASSDYGGKKNGMLYWWFAYYSNWALIFSCFYQIFSFFNSIFSERITQPPERVTGRCKATWILFTMAANANLVGLVLYWGLIYYDDADDVVENHNQETIQYLTIAQHGGVAFVVLLDGLLINRIPIRWMHFWVWVLLYNMLYMTWTVIQSDLVLGLHNPNSYNETDGGGDSTTTTGDGDAIYPALSWSEDWQKALMYSAVIVFGISPLIYTILWLLSLYGFCWLVCCCKNNDQRRYVDSHLDKIRLDEDKKRKQAAAAKSTKSKKAALSSSSRIFDPSVDGGDVELEEVSIFASATSPTRQ